MSISFKQVFYVLATIIGAIFLLYLGRTVLVPLAFGLLAAFILYPVCVWLEKKGVNRLWSILWTIISVTIVIAGILLLFSTQIFDIIKEFGDFSQRLNDLLLSVTQFLNENVSIIPEVNRDSIINMGLQWFSNQSGGMLTDTLNLTALFVTGLTLTLIYTFLMLLYRKPLRKAFINFSAPEHHKKYDSMIRHAQQVGQQYLTGMFLLILILGALNSLGLFIIGIDYALFFGFLAGFLAIIPYVGTTIGGALPAIYAFMNHDSYWYPLGVIMVFWFIQILEGNFLNPKIVGGNLNINALASIVALIAGGLIWGVPGMILFLPYVAVFKVVCEYYDQLKPVGMLLKDEESRRGGIKKKVDKILKKK